MLHISLPILPTFSLAIFFLLASTPASAQVFRCEKNGQVTYQQAPCSASHKSKLVEAERTAEQVMTDRRNEAESVARMQEQQLRANRENYQNSMNRAPVVERAWQQHAAPRVDQELCAAKTRSLRIAGSKTYQTANEKVAALTAAELAVDQACRTSTAGTAANLEATRQQRAAAESRNRSLAVPPSTITHCAGSYCYDDQGGAYFSQGNSQFIGPAGQSCNTFIGEMQCQ